MKKWFVLQVYANSELAVKRTIEAQQEHGFFQEIEEIYVPIEEIISISPKGKQTELKKAMYSGYIYLKIEDYDPKKIRLTNLNKVSKIVGEISEEEINIIKSKIEGRSGKPKYRVSYQEGDKVLIKEGPFMNFKGEVEEFIPEKNMIKVQVDIFGRKTDVELNVKDVEEIKE